MAGYMTVKVNGRQKFHNNWGFGIRTMEGEGSKTRPLARHNKYRNSGIMLKLDNTGGASGVKKQ